jgi:hypothetical protein
MLYTVSGVQILATLDAFGELDERVKDGRLKIGKCTYSSVVLFPSNAHESQSLQICRIVILAHLQAMNGENKTPASYTGL